METKQLRLCVWGEFPRRGVELGIVGKVISEQSIVLPFFVVFEIVLGRWYLLKSFFGSYHHPPLPPPLPRETNYLFPAAKGVD